MRAEGSAGGGRRAGVRFGLVGVWGVWACERVATKHITKTAYTNCITQHYNTLYYIRCSTLYAILHYTDVLNYAIVALRWM